MPWKIAPKLRVIYCKSVILQITTLQGVDSPIGVSSVDIFDSLTADFKSALPSIEDIENELREPEQEENEDEP